MSGVPGCLLRHAPDELVALCGRVVEANLHAELAMSEAGELYWAAHHADTAECWSGIAFAASREHVRRRHG